MNVEQIGSLTAGTINPEATGGHSSAANKLMGIEAAGDMSGFTALEMGYVQAKYMGDDESVGIVLIATRNQIASMALKGKWKIRPSQLSILADIATHEALSPCRCRKCNGVGRKLNKVCLSCSGSGLGHESTVAMARAVGVDNSVFHRCYKEKLVHALAFLYDIESSIRIKLSLHNNNWTTAQS
ncbi:hypothetical protein [Methylobacter sp. S3L5C]|uniref:hypothetical protein n=1 Tax=Methylobacter sp. S3L5C TaxID=2839024 RepID=UPI001FACCCCB|nr:hypothetical protein [Methylobacter sp. S3L5C]UOA08340.1 hypothetical protein KKZ03_19390 [Methylobacter sp. S3L5C]